ncbi:YkyA family protein [Salipaludibacillus agaradhaerens]|uniref:YkyA family protein n=1 Tax=Salipaludibacillus agaradhaerens TaxID=76935 RepID=A0A9Q4FY88_SALAG|nr:YkyA family protein [Salipaludibacillus agaradhaerens]MCR6095882.1 YkyA family protein [Salipaludibacillus agaradhaerens]MCR6114559.1 YkyA family protein [Salipaludibacillus agaradhaerens]
MKNLVIGITFLSLLTILSGCVGDDPAELMYDQLETSVQIENEMKSLQEPLVEAEKKEVQLYNDMASLSSLEEIEPLSQKAIESAETRRSMMEEEKKIIDNAFEAFQEAEQYLEELEEDQAKEAGQTLIDIQNERKSVYEELYTQYVKSIDEDIKLFEMVVDEESHNDELEGQQEKVNESYARITELSDEFNVLLNDFNEAKIVFYESVGFNVTTK